MKIKIIITMCVVAVAGYLISEKYNLYRNYLTDQPLRTVRRPDVTLVGRVILADGICRLGIDIAEALKGEALISAIAPKKRLEGLSSYQKSIFERDNKTMGKVVILTDALFYQKNDPNLPNYYKIIHGKSPSNQIRYVYSMLESSQIPQIWVEMINESYDAVIVPDPYLIDVYKNCGVEKPIFMVPFPITLDNYLNQPIKKDVNEIFTFGCTSSCISRKNLLVLVKAFHLAFKDQDGVCLKINSRYAHDDAESELVNYLNEFKPRNVHYSQFELPENAYLKFMTSLDCFVTLSRGEGFSIQPRQAMALGIPTIVTDNTSQSTIARNQIAVPVKSAMPKDAYYFFSKYPIGHEYECEIQDAADAMKEVYTNYQTYLSKAEDARAWAAKYDAKELKDFYLALVKPKIVLKGSENIVSSKSITTTSDDLIEKYQKLGVILEK